MKKLFFAVLSFLIFSCSEKPSNKQNVEVSKFSIKIVDTLFVNAKEEIILIENIDSRTDVSEDLKFYYNYNQKQHLIDVINLDEMRFERKIQLEREGPNGTGKIKRIDFTKSGQVLINSKNKIQVFNYGGEKIKQIRLDNDNLKGDSLVGREYIDTFFGILSDDGRYCYTIYFKNFFEPGGVAIINLKDQTFTKRPIIGLDKIKEFKVSYNGTYGRVVGPGLFFKGHDNQILISNDYINELYVYDIANDCTYHHTYKSNFLKNYNSKPSKQQTNSIKEFKSLLDETGNSIRLRQIIPDPTHKRYYRFSKGEKLEGNRSSMVLTVFDEQFHQVFETDNISLNSYIDVSFVKDDNIFVLENIEDEMAFVVMKIQEI
ncbi:DUF4221 family protein [Echinicola sp. CAU 1574]|uniref:DUF4221 family protein n=1 Tax=Echinicola arenosa TaxID=2774144 RepID=A0ABR9AIY9_9BACT|nr:DUF4221 family protein [Echinicola arenosa]MBD8488805.1 DUF4221 family protein [Echinicola arenosa]